MGERGAAMVISLYTQTAGRTSGVRQTSTHMNKLQLTTWVNTALEECKHCGHLLKVYTRPTCTRDDSQNYPLQGAMMEWLFPWTGQYYIP